MKYPHIAARLLERPLLLEPRKLDTILAAIGPRMDAGVDWGMAIPAREVRQSDAGFEILDGVAMLPVIGSLVHRGGFMEAASGLTSYQALDLQFSAALADPNVEAILLEIDSPGGEASGVFDLADRIYAARGSKPIYAAAADQADSAGYLLASAADRVIATRTAELGSIGVVTAHVDLSQATEKQGVAVTYIYAGEHKVDANPYQPLPEDVRERIQGEIDTIYSMFVSTVARNRGLTQEAVRATQALTYMGDAAVQVGLADEVATLATAFAEVSAAAGAPARRSLNQPQEAVMPKLNEPEREPSQVSAPQDEPTPQRVAAVDIAKACAEAGMPSEAVAELIAAEPTTESLEAEVARFRAEQAAKAERERTIRDLCAAAHQDDLAQTFIAAGMSVSAARSVLDKMTSQGAPIDSRQPAEVPRKGLNAFDIYRQRRAAVQQKRT